MTNKVGIFIIIESLQSVGWQIGDKKNCYVTDNEIDNIKKILFDRIESLIVPI